MTNAVRTKASRLETRSVFRDALRGDARRRLLQPLILFSADDEERRAIPTLLGQYYLSLTEAVREARAAARAGLAGVLLFAAPDRKDETAVIAAESDWLVPRAIRAIKDAVPDLGVATDVCVCAYTRHGQCVLFSEGAPDVAATHARLGEIATTHAAAGADLLIPSGALAGSVAAIRDALAAAALGDVEVSGVVKFESALYQPYRTAVGIPHSNERAVPLVPLGDINGALAVAARELGEGADAIAVKPGIVALDVVAALRSRVRVPIIAAHVAGEYAMQRAVEELGLEPARLAVETAMASRRAGADLVVTYAAIEAADNLEGAPA
ncbi:MAG: porphobilinogen synthase [Chloroflexi bacterium]|nr:MAG: porphobilinogen synthase [Chloroflexota bacterium]